MKRRHYQSGAEKRKKRKEDEKRKEQEKGDTEKLSELRIVLMGSRGAGKSSAGNIILNREEFDLKTTAQCVKRQREVADRHITVIEAPGWWIDVPVEESRELLKQEILLSVTLCPPGPHVVLLFIPVGTGFKEEDRKVFQGYVDLLSERVWSHTIVLFTFGDFLGDTSIEQHIESEGEDLQWLVEKCGNRYHVLNNKNRSDDTQIKDLLEKIEETVTQNNGCHFEIDRKILQELEEKRRAEEQRAEERKKRMNERREMIFSEMSDTPYLSELRIVLMGYKGAGKSSAGNIILNREEFDLKTTAQCVKRQREVADRHITVIEAPGWWINVPVDQSSELLKQEILLSVSLCPPGPHVVLLFIRVDTGFKDDKRKVFQEYVDLLGERVWSHTIVLFTCGDFLGDTSIEQHIESEGEDLQWLVEKCGNRYHVLNNKNRSDDTQIKDLLEKIEETVTQNNGCHFEIDRKILQELEEKRRAEEERAEERVKRMKKQREMISDTQKLSELRIVLMGYKCAGKSSSGNIILNREEFDLKTTAQCVKRQREVADKHITVIEAPGWWINVPVEQSSELLKQEILLSVSLCPPGPHVVLLVIRVDTRFKEDERKVFQGFVDLLGERVWSHTIVLFTCGDFLGDTSIEQHIESEGEDLQWLVEKCGNRYHVLNNKNRSDDTQIKDLLEKIEETVTQNNGCHFEIDRKILQELEEKRRAEEERADERVKRMKKQREMIRSQMRDTQKLSELRIVLMGSRGAGKSSAGNIILKREEFDLKTTAQCVKRQREVADRHITVIEAPGWWRHEPVDQSPELLKQEILLSVSMCPPGPHVVLLVIRADIRFKEDERKVFQGYVDLLSERVWSHTIVLFTHGDFLGDTSIEQHIESEGEDLQWLVEKCGNRYHVLNNNNRSDDTQIKDLLEKIEETVTQNKGCHFEIDRKILQELVEKCGNRYHVLNNKNRSEDTQIKDLLEKIEETVTQNKGCHFEIDRKILQELEEKRRAEEERARSKISR
ncbi:GTPase IMAP family member 8-like [Triplophysa dalaica]|uniref:GTPase IMAP family member 8-like n=1 Tax=Triplophysa dalaica TaxID=1582913 RepID=UPI0024DFBF53|nr:GTPase IMAP family member 8-like [Triplophysa dalaica]